MLEAEPMLHLQAVILQRDQSAVLEGLGRLGVLQLAPTPLPPGSPLRPPPALHAESTRWEVIRQRAHDLRRALESREPLPIDLGPAGLGVRGVERGVWRSAGPPYRRGEREASWSAAAPLPHSYTDPAGQGRESDAHSSGSRVAGRTRAPGKLLPACASPAISGPPATQDHRPAAESPAPSPAGKLEPRPSPEEQLTDLDRQVTPLLRRYEGLARDWTRLEALRKRRHHFVGLPAGLQRPDQGGFLQVYVGYIPRRSLEDLIRRLPPPTTLWRNPAEAERLPVVIATPSSRQAAVDQALREAGFEAETQVEQTEPPDDTPSRAPPGPPLDDLSRRNLREEGCRLSWQLHQWDEAARAPLLRLEHQAETEGQIVEARRLCPRTEATIAFSGWIPATERPAVERALTRITGGVVALEFSPPARRRGETAPTLLRPPAWLRPFTPLVTAFGRPAYHEIVPTLFVAISYPLMFGAMFGDVGHGGILAVAGMALARARNEARHRQAGWLLSAAGLSAVAFGWLYGSCFGLPAFKRHAGWHDPLEADPAALMLGAVAVGIVLISLGLLLNIVNRLRRLDLTGALLDRFGLAGLLFYWGVVGLLAFPASPLATCSKSTLAILIAIPLAAWTLKGPVDQLLHSRSRPGEPVEGLASVLAESAVGTFEGLLQFLANTVSFVRLAAYALSHAALLMATFSLAAQVGQSPVLGSTGAWAIIVLGNLITLVLEGIVASVQALRLEYYEFFGKFFAGDGLPFEPFRLRPAPLESTVPPSP